MSDRISSMPLKTQLALISLASRDHRFFADVKAVLNPDFFQEELGEVVGLLIDYHSNHRKLPKKNTLCEELPESMSLIERLFKIDLSAFDKEYYVETAYKNARFQLMEDFLIHTSTNMESALNSGSSFDFDSVLDTVEEIKRKSSRVQVGESYFDTPRERLRNLIKGEQFDLTVATGLPTFDSIIGGGLHEGEMGVILAPPNRGKSMFLVNFGWWALKFGFNVLHVSNEMSKLRVENRYDARTSLMNDDERKENPTKALKRIEKLQANTKGKLQVVREHRRLSVDEIHAATIATSDKWEEPVHLVVVDYADIVRPRNTSRGADFKRHEQAEIYTDLRDIAVDLGCALWTASQGNRATFNENIVDLAGFSEAIDKAAIADIVLALCQDREEYSKSYMRLHAAKVREGRAKDIIGVRHKWDIAYYREGEIDAKTTT